MEAPLLPQHCSERPARLVNQALLPKNRKLSKLIEATSPSITGVCIAIASSDLPLEFDIPVETLSNAPLQIAAFLRSRLTPTDRRANGAAVVLEKWQEHIQGSVFDV